MDKKAYLWVGLTRTTYYSIKAYKAIYEGMNILMLQLRYGRDLRNMYSFGRKYIYNPFIGAFRREYIDMGVYMLPKRQYPAWC